MRHIIIGGDGFVGARLAADLLEMGEDVVVADIAKQPHAHYDKVQWSRLDVTDPSGFKVLGLCADDMVYNMAAKMLSPLMTRAKRHDFFYPVNDGGVGNLLTAMERAGTKRLIQFTTDMVYGHSIRDMAQEDHPKAPIGKYGASKLDAEKRCMAARDKGFAITIIRPRLIIGPGRLGILGKLFKLVDLNLPVPMIGSGRNPYQFISVYDCASAAIAAWKAGVPNREYHLGSDNPPPVRELLGALICAAGSRSILVPTPAPLVKLTLDMFDLINLPIMDPEQYKIADEFCTRDTSAAKSELGWQPMYRDSDMLNAAYREYRAAIDKANHVSLAHSVA
jgi:dTDP-glucose 4,6-dehydratase